MLKFKAKDSEINAAPFCLDNFSRDFSVNNMKKTRLCRYVYDFSADHDSTDVVNFLHIHKYLMKEHDIK